MQNSSKWFIYERGIYMSDNTNNGLIDFSNFASDTEETVETNTNSSLDKLRRQNAAADEVENLIAVCKNEDELLRLRNKIIDTDYGPIDKKEMLAALDAHVLKKIEPIIKEASLLEKRQEDKKNIKLGVITFVVLGIVLFFFFPLALPICIGLAVLGAIGNAGSSKKEIESSENAARIVSQYRSAGYPVDEGNFAGK